MTSAPRSPSSIVQYGPASAWLKSRTRMPASGSGATLFALDAGADIVRCLGLPPEQRDVSHDSKVLAHRLRSELRVSRLDGGKNAPMCLERARWPAGLAERFDTALLDNLRHGVDQVQQDLVARGQRDGVVKRRERRKLHLERLSGFEHIRKAAAALEQLRKRLAEPARAAEEHPLPMPYIDESKCLQHDEGLAHRSAADVQPLGELAFGRELVSRPHARLAHELAEPLAHVLIQAPAALERSKRRC